MQAGIGTLSRITQLDLSNNRLTSLPSGFLANASSLSELRAHFNNITFVDDHALRGAPNLRVLDFSRQTAKGGLAVIPAGLQLVGLDALQAVRWTSAACPAGTGLGLSDEAAGIYICLPCADGSYLAAGGGSLADCRACPSGWTDDDRDPATPCVPCNDPFSRHVHRKRIRGRVPCRSTCAQQARSTTTAMLQQSVEICHAGNYSAAGSLGIVLAVRGRLD
jgi:hypothetical protein